MAERLTTHGMLVDQTCKLCRNEVETIEHVLFQSIKAQELWSEFQFPVAQVFQATTLRYLLNECIRLMGELLIDQRRRQAIPWMLWTIWKNRNNILYAEIQESSSILVQRAIEETSLWHELNKTERREEPKDLGVPQKWMPPSPGLIKCNVHANWRSGKLLVGAAWITRDHKGVVGMHTRDALVPSPDKLAGEMSCLLWVLRSLRDLRMQEVSIGTDSQQLVDAIKNPHRWPRYRGLLCQIDTICSEFTVIAFKVESENSNDVVRSIAKSVL